MSTPEGPLPAARRAATVLDRLEPISSPVAHEVVQQVRAALPLLVPRQHPLGFLHLDLSDLTDVPGLRLHVWTDDFAEGADPLGRLHDHTWELRSAVLLGRLIDHVLLANADPRGNWRAHRVRYREARNEPDPIPGLWSLHEIEARDVRAGESYGLAPRLVHRTEILMESTATLVHAVANSEPSEGPTVYAPASLTSAGAAPRSVVASGRAHEALSHVLAGLESSA